MCVVIGDVNTFVAYPVGNSNRRKTLVDQKADVTVSQIMDSNAIYAGFLTTTLHFPIQIAFRDRKHPVIQANVVLHLQILLHFICQKAWHRNCAIALFCFWRRDDVFPAGVLKCLADRDCAFIKVEICRGQRQQLSLPNAAPVQHLKSIKRQQACPSLRQ